MQDFTLAMVQHDSYLGKKKENLEKTLYFMQQAHEKGADLVVFPELNITGHAGHILLRKEAEEWQDSPSLRAVCDAAQKWNIYAAVGMATLEKNKLYNRQILCGPEGIVNWQDKIHLSLDEEKYFTGGSEFRIAQLPFAKVGMIICYDCFFPETARCLSVLGAEVLLFCNAARHVDTDWIQWTQDPEQQKPIVAGMKEYFSIIARCRALENRCYAGLCNGTGESGKWVGVTSNHAGGCLIVDPCGSILSQSSTPFIQEEMIVQKLSAEKEESLRQHPNAPMKKRKKACFSILTQ
ncbi:MAG: carbon-nitrogen hydrolase family protein [Eubacteriales bacterium]|jgi:predicted amidohydrolase